MTVGRDRHAWAASPCADGEQEPAVGPWLRFWLCVWALVLVGALGALWKYKLTPGAAATVVERWPAGSALTHSTKGPTLIMFAHPRCPCTRASLAELRSVMSSFAGKLTAEVVFFDAGSGAGFSPTDTTDAARTISGVVVTSDPGGREAHRFGATTSGHVVLYDAGGLLRFSGGITPARGHQGDSPGKRRLLEQLAQSSTREGAERRDSLGVSQHSSSVYGCSIEEQR